MAKDRIGTIGTRGTLNTAAKTMTTDRNMFLLPERMCVFLVQGSPALSHLRPHCGPQPSILFVTTWFVCAMPCSICFGIGHNIKTCTSLSEAEHNVIVKQADLLYAQRELASLQQRHAQQSVVNSVRKAALAKKKAKPGEKGESQSKGRDTEKEVSSDDACVPDSATGVPWEKINVPPEK